MAADVEIKRITGVVNSEVLTNVTTLTTRLDTSDNPTTSTANPVAAPASGLNYSFWATFRLVAKTAPATEINHIRMYSAGSNTMGTGLGAKVSTVPCSNGDISTTYTRATGTAGVTGLEMGSNYGHSITTPVAFETLTVGSPLLLTGGFVTGSDTAADNESGSFGDAIVLQCNLGPTAGAGPSVSQSLTYIYDEF